MSESNKLYKKAQIYRDLGWSIIPIWGASRPDQFKAAAVRWREFQTRHATDSELQQWFINRGCGGMAVVCGTISGLAVLDFDAIEHANAFMQLYPDLAETYTVRSGGRGLPHLYFQIPSHLATRTRRTPGVDWQFNGTYVVAPPTTSADGSWTVEQTIAPKILSEADLSRIMGFLDVIDQNNTPNVVTTLSARSSDIPVSSQHQVTGTTPEQIVQHYKSRVSGGRNKALFETCIWLRNNGETVNTAMMLVGVHISQPAPPGHSSETSTQRREEALKTIMSAFSRPSGQRQRVAELQVIPNALRERLLAEKRTALLRVLEAIHDIGWKPGQTFTRTELVDIAAKYDVGDWSVRKALATAAPGNHPIFPEVANRADAAVLEGVNPPQLNAIELRVSVPTQNEKRGRGRPTIHYVVPSLRALCKLYGVTMLAGDAIDRTALGSVKRYRHALHTALLVRRPGQYHRQWLAQRLGVSLRTICRYNTASHIRVSPRYNEYPVIWQNLHSVMPSGLNDPHVSHYGAFLEDDTGKRYPPFMAIARTLLSRKRKVRYKRRVLNHYSVLPKAPPPQIADPPDATAAPLTVRPSRNVCSEPQMPASPMPDPQPVPVNKSRALTPDELHSSTALRSATNNTISEQRSHQLVMTYGAFAVRHALRTLDERGASVRNKAGFVVRLLQSRHGAAGDLTSAAEGVYLALQDSDGKSGVSWERAQALVSKYGIREVTLVLREMHQRDDILNPVGFLVSSLKRNAQAVNRTTDPDEAITHLVDAIRAKCSDRALSRKMAQQLVKQYGVKAVMRAVSVVQTRDNIENPAGFVIVYLRSEAKTRRRIRT